MSLSMTWLIGTSGSIGRVMSIQSIETVAEVNPLLARPADNQALEGAHVL
jgi:hypothetical protein